MPRDWDAFYRQNPVERAPAFVVRAYGPLVPRGPVLDLAGGLGRNALYFLDRGHPVVLVEKSREALRKLKGIRGLTLVGLDLEDPNALMHLPKGPFAAILMSYYVNRPLLKALPPLLAPGGLLLVEGFSRREAVRRNRPESPFYWEPYELLTPPPGLVLRAFGEGWMEGYRVFAVYQNPRP
ncbi:SAM-dependent methyltransferase [Thermus scotoductus]|uniref:SAM-dependent methyltransferase n=1 Tax=Thermus scotoductus TaxID=37636 RepID=A0A430RSN9_THESC|nr:SAM-dependent methyltransferase [Thermus scotoductus]RTH22446.1 SAM-dependent methyltransferase [Thermus scotoductus]RTI33515.1 SAM-dependent methyltransferase [Thermus scotoductus]